EPLEAGAVRGPVAGQVVVGEHEHRRARPALGGVGTPPPLLPVDALDTPGRVAADPRVDGDMAHGLSMHQPGLPRGNPELGTPTRRVRRFRLDLRQTAAYDGGMSSKQHITATTVAEVL